VKRAFCPAAFGLRRVLSRAQPGGRGGPTAHVRQLFHAAGDVVDLRLDHPQKVGRQSRGVVGRGQAGSGGGGGRLVAAAGRSAVTVTAQQVTQTDRDDGQQQVPSVLENDRPRGAQDVHVDGTDGRERRK